MLSQTSEYALRAVVHLAQNGGGPASAHDIAAATKAPMGFLQKILRSLSRASILKAQRGVGGGFRLGQSPSQISVLDVLVACGDPIPRIESCPLGLRGHTRLCSLHQLLDTQLASVEKVFKDTSIADLLSSRVDIRPLCDTMGAVAPSVSSSHVPTKPD